MLFLYKKSADGIKEERKMEKEKIEREINMNLSSVLTFSSNYYSNLTPQQTNLFLQGAGLFEKLTEGLYLLFPDNSAYNTFAKDVSEQIKQMTEKLYLYYLPQNQDASEAINKLSQIISQLVADDSFLVKNLKETAKNKIKDSLGEEKAEKNQEIIDRWAKITAQEIALYLIRKISYDISVRPVLDKIENETKQIQEIIDQREKAEALREVETYLSMLSDIYSSNQPDKDSITILSAITLSNIINGLNLWWSQNNKNFVELLHQSLADLGLNPDQKSISYLEKIYDLILQEIGTEPDAQKMLEVLTDRISKDLTTKRYYVYLKESMPALILALTRYKQQTKRQNIGLIYSDYIGTKEIPTLQISDKIKQNTQQITALNQAKQTNLNLMKEIEDRLTQLNPQDPKDRQMVDAILFVMKLMKYVLTTQNNQIDHQTTTTQILQDTTKAILDLQKENIQLYKSLLSIYTNLITELKATKRLETVQDIIQDQKLSEINQTLSVLSQKVDIDMADMEKLIELLETRIKIKDNTIKTLEDTVEVYRGTIEELRGRIEVHKDMVEFRDRRIKELESNVDFWESRANYWYTKSL